MGIYSGYKPQARNDLLIQEIDEEVLVYHAGLGQAHCLNATAAEVWALCDGQTTVEDLAKKLQTKMSGPVNEEIVWLALEHLQKARLLTAAVPPRAPQRMTRRSLMQKLAFAAVAVPLVSTILAPLPAAAASGICALTDCATCTNLAVSATCPTESGSGLSCGPCLGNCCRGGNGCGVGNLCGAAENQPAVLASCTECDMAIVPIGTPDCPQDLDPDGDLGLIGCSCSDQGPTVFQYPKCSFAAT